MDDYSLVAVGLLATFIVNLPFGYWRAKSKEQGSRLKWFLAIHAPVPFIAVLRREIDVGWDLIPLFIIAFSAGQYLGGLIYKKGYLKGYMPGAKGLPKV